MKTFFTNIITEPIYNLLLLLVNFITSDLGIVIIILTIIIRLALFPLSRSQIKTQIKMQEIQVPLKKIQEKYKKDKQKMGEEMLKLYRENKVNPFSGIFLIMIQLPVLIGLYYVFMNSGLPEINQNLIYSFVRQPENISTMFLGFVDMTAKSLPIAILVFVSQFIQMKIISPKKTENKPGNNEMNTEDMMKNVQKQMTYVMPAMLFFVAYSFGAIIALYLLTGNLFSIGQELYIRKTIKNPANKKAI